MVTPPHKAWVHDLHTDMNLCTCVWSALHPPAQATPLQVASSCSSLYIGGTHLCPNGCTPIRGPIIPANTCWGQFLGVSHAASCTQIHIGIYTMERSAYKRCSTATSPYTKVSKARNNAEAHVHMYCFALWQFTYALFMCRENQCRGLWQRPHRTAYAPRDSHRQCI